MRPGAIPLHFAEEPPWGLHELSTGITDGASLPPPPHFQSNRQATMGVGRQRGGETPPESPEKFPEGTCTLEGFLCRGKAGPRSRVIWRTVSARSHLWPDKARLATLPRWQGRRGHGVSGASIPPLPLLPAPEGSSMKTGVCWIMGTAGSISDSAVFPGTTGMLSSNLTSTGFVYMIVIHSFLLK